MTDRRKMSDDLFPALATSNVPIAPFSATLALMACPGARALPAGDDAVRRANRSGHDMHERAQRFWRVRAFPSQCFESHDDQRVSGQQRQRLAKRNMRGRFAAPEVRRVKAREIVMHERRAMQKLNRRRRGRRVSRFAATGLRDRNTERRANPRPARKNRRAHRLG